MNISFKTLSLAIASAGLLTLAGCGGGGSSAPTPPAVTSVTVTPSLGRFSGAAVVSLKKPDGTVLVSGTLGTNGTYTGSIPADYTGPVVVVVQGGTGVTYYDEGSNSSQPFGATQSLRAVMPAPQGTVGVTALTNAAVSNLEAAGTLALATTANINDANAKIAMAIGLSSASILQAPTLVDATTTAHTLDVSVTADKYALVLAALANTASSSSTTAADIAVALANDLKDGKLDGVDATSITAPTTAIANAPSASSIVGSYTAAATALATSTSQTVIASAPLTPVTNVTNVTATLSSDLSLAKAMFAELRTTLSAFYNGSTGFLDTQAKKASDDLKATVPPALDKVANRLGALSTAADVYQAAKAYTSSITGGLTIGVDPSGSTTNNVLIYQVGDLYATWNGWGTFEKCWTDSSTPASVTKVTCSSFGSTSADTINTRFKFVQFVLTPTTTANQYSYTATRYNRKVTLTNGLLSPINNTFPWNGSAGLATNSLLSTTTATVYIPVGTGTFTKSTDSSLLTLNGTLPPSTNMCVAPNASSSTQQSLDCPTGQILIPATDVDTIVINAARTALTTANNYHYAMNGSVSTVNALDTTKVSSISLDSGTYVDMNETNANTTGSLMLGAQLIGTVQTAATKFTGAVTLGSFMFDADQQNYTPTNITFNGSISDISAGGAGQMLTGQLTASLASYNTYHSLSASSSTNFEHGSVNFTGTVKAPSRPPLTLVVAASRVNATDNSATIDYTDGTAHITGTATTTVSGNTLTLSNQDGIQVTHNNATGGWTVTKAGATLATISNGMINYIDGVSEALGW